jgi:hypothetical protein
VIVTQTRSSIEQFCWTQPPYMKPGRVGLRAGTTCAVAGPDRAAGGHRQRRASQPQDAGPVRGRHALLNGTLLEMVPVEVE